MTQSWINQNIEVIVVLYAKWYSQWFDVRYAGSPCIHTASTCIHVTDTTTDISFLISWRSRGVYWRKFDICSPIFMLQKLVLTSKKYRPMKGKFVLTTDIPLLNCTMIAFVHLYHTISIISYHTYHMITYHIISYHAISYIVSHIPYHIPYLFRITLHVIFTMINCKDIKIDTKSRFIFAEGNWSWHVELR